MDKWEMGELEMGNKYVRRLINV